MVIAVTGTPGTGKETFARILAKKIDGEVISFNRLVEEEKAYRVDKEDTKVVNLAKVKRAFARRIAEKKVVIVEGHLSHWLPKKLLTHVVVLRTHPGVLKKRLIKKGQRGRKLLDNIEAEALDIILWEAVKMHGRKKVYEIDTSRRSPETAVNLFLQAVKEKKSLAPGKVSWLEDYFSHFVKRQKIDKR
ncbi:MAG: adenylate kinase family protein [Candidatus Hadarchaeales archaeon]